MEPLDGIERARRSPFMNENVKYIVFKQEVVKVWRDDKNFWVDSYGTIYAFVDRSNAADKKDACGIGPLTVPEWDFFIPINQICRVHDYMGMSPAYQAFNTFSDANDYLENGITRYGEYLAWLATPFRFFASHVKFWWENKETLR